MKKNLFKTKYLMGGALLGLLMTFGVSLINHKLSSREISIYGAGSGVGICFQRVTQTFTALMIRELQSSYLSSEFRDMTSECFNEVGSLLSKFQTKDLVLKRFNNLKSDLHWFDKKVSRVSEMASKGDIDLTQSNITSKYSDLESLKSSLEEDLLSAVSSSKFSRSLSFAGIIIGQVMLLLSAIALFLQRKISKSEAESIEEESLLRASQGDFKDHAFSILSRALKLKDFKETAKEWEAYHLEQGASILKLKNEKRSLENNILQMNTLGNERFEIDLGVEATSNTGFVESIESSDFGEPYSMVLDRLQAKAFKLGVLLDTNLADKFSVCSTREVLEQFLFSLISFSMEKSVEGEEGRKLTIRSKSLGAIAYCKIKISNYIFSNEDLSVLRGEEPCSSTPVNLLLLRELVKDANATLGVKSKQGLNGNIESEIEVLFQRVQENRTLVEGLEKEGVSRRPQGSIVKGNKKTIQKYFEKRL